MVSTWIGFQSSEYKVENTPISIREEESNFEGGLVTLTMKYK